MAQYYNLSQASISVQITPRWAKPKFAAKLLLKPSIANIQ